MAKLDTYGSSPNCSLFNDWNLTSEPFSNSDFGIVDPDPIELFEDLNDWPPSIFSDIKKIQSDTSATSSGSMSSGDEVHYIDFFEPEMKPEIRNIDCMWSAQPSTTGVGGSSVIQQDTLAANNNNVVGGGVTTAVPLAAVIENAQNISNNKQQLQPPAMYQRLGGNNKATSQHVASSDVQTKAGGVASDVSIKVEPIDDDYEKQLQQHSIPNSRTALLQQQQMVTQQSLQHIKPGMSLLRKSNVQQQQQQKKQPQQQTSKFNGSIKIPAKTTAEFLRERDQASAATMKNVAGFGAATPSAAFGRPDTPLSLDDDPVPNEFKHSVDLRACVMGSNNISLVANDPTNIINHLSEQLQDTTKNRIDLRNLMPDTACDFADVLDLIVKDDRSLASTALNTSISGSSSCSDNQGHNRSNVHYLNKRTFESDDEEDADDDDENDDDEYEDDMGSSCRSAASSTSSSSSLHNRSLSSSVAGLNSSTSAYVSATSPLSSNGSSMGGVSGGVGGTTTSSGNCSSSSSQQQQTYPIMLHSDHSYTRCNEDLGTNLETPSDSDEEIDVVSIGDKKLPTNPSAKDRRALQNKVAHKFSNARIVKTANGVRTIPPRRRITVELPYTPASSSPVKSVANSRYPSPSTTPYQNQYTTKYVQQQTQHMMSVMSGGGGGEKHRKRMAAAATLAAPQSSAVGGGGGGLIRGGGGGVCVGASSSGGILDYLPPSKKHRNSKKQKQQQLLQHQQQQYGGHGSTSSSPSSSAAAASVGDIVNQRHYSLDETADTMEKRNLHNDMERQRRIGLKNLFEALKKQIPSIREKERAPKVNILREAAKLCEALTREDQQLSEQKMMLKEQLRKRQELLARLRSGGGIGTIVGGGASNATQRD